jgi:hypothetical protein
MILRSSADCNKEIADFQDTICGQIDTIKTTDTIILRHPTCLTTPESMVVRLVLTVTSGIVDQVWLSATLRIHRYIKICPV